MNARPRGTDAVLVVVDISGYTRFVQQRSVSLEHAEAIVTDLVEAIIDEADHPLVVNKLEGDAALLYAETRGDRSAAVGDVVLQLGRFFRAFTARLRDIARERAHCTCDACANIGDLRLKAFLHVGEIVVKRVRNFEEIAGEAVIFVHRLMKNALPSREYVLMSDAFHATVTAAACGEAFGELEPHTETIDGVAARLHWCDASTWLARSRATATLPRAAAPRVVGVDSGVPPAPEQRSAAKAGSSSRATNLDAVASASRQRSAVPSSWWRRALAGLAARWR